LFDDRALVQVRGDVVRGGTDLFDAAGVRLMVRTGALEAGQERVVDIDRPPDERAATVVGQHLHIARQHHQVNVQLVDELQQACLSSTLGLGGDRHVVKVDAV